MKKVVWGVISTAKIGRERVTSALTTPEAPDLQALLAAMPAHLPSAGALTTKLVSLFPENRDRPTHQALICAFDPATGTPEAVMDGRVITEITNGGVQLKQAAELGACYKQLNASVGTFGTDTLVAATAALAAHT